MKVYEVAKKLKIKSKELIKQIDDPRIDHHLDTVPEDILATLDVEEKKIGKAKPEPTKTVDSAETVLVGGESNESKTDSNKDSVDVNCESTIKTDECFEHILPNSSEHVSESEECPYTSEQIRTGIRGCGNKSSMWKWRHLLDA
jgi:hypothetical protein